MVEVISRRVFLAGLGAALSHSAAYAEAPALSLRPPLRPKDAQALAGPEAVLSGSGLSGRVAFAVADAETGLELETVEPGLALPPASVAKALTALYALETLGPSHRFRTRVLADGPVENGVLKGDLILAGGGDPTLDTDALAALARALKESGLREVRGAFKVYDGALPEIYSIDPKQPEHVGYSPSVSGIALNFNRVHFEWKRAGKGWSISMDARSSKIRPVVAIAEMKVVNRALPIYTYEQRQRIDSWTVASQALGQDGARWLPVRKPALYAGDVFQTLARSNGIVLGRVEVVRSLPASARMLVHHDSAPLEEILRDMLKYSTNLTAEMVGLAATVARGKRPATLRASAEEMTVWAAERYGLRGSRLVDHSGLGDASRMTARDLVAVLVQAGKTGRLPHLLKDIPMRDPKGRVLKGHPIKVAAKTGTLNFVSGLGGFMTGVDGTVLAFAILTADTDRRAAIPPEDRERPEGARGWNARSKKLQQALIERWGAIYGS
ncbi:D-alanyl-D-alanine carboxypeptidase/D-alanyl-D-alanine-endopeptidase [Ruegeria pomeroyi]|nr:D-alanyl-D-alanine carboxypeptidase/D-alanyl-D-alanine-endopeptidase [Ruegeria pomeroyi]MCE8520609.1 D-alanyl-D-alanine carboxypeptidase/D-alanyl-D-alanine-endopeptidase [Ruegeria pomeroyi]MCE8528621.1 D-alanyl-D-alanine carboxypeptidase/D-alanyl-D-alanine-endopeptidase [Ruegeria pomeroyi]MCE8532958.1 D-alanyl-D-alanine carboxypeptidase/D-alanyl-D-alanine-endopeptidase [Ruegeria pomeroyi]